MPHPYRPPARLLLALTLLTSLLLGPPGLTTHATAETDDDLDQRVSAGEATVEEQVVFTEGHVDLGPRFLDGEWTLLVRDDAQAPPVWRHLDDVVLHLDDPALPAPDDEQFAFLDAEPGSDVWVVPQTQATEVVWAGWNSQDPEVVSRLSGGMTLRLHGVQGPGQFVLFLQNGNFAPAQLLWSSSVPEPQDLWVEPNTHVHGNWVFTEPGVYLLDVEVSGELADGSTASDRTWLRVAVGADTDPLQALTAVPEQEAATPPPAPPTEPAPAATTASTLTVPLLVGGGVALLVAVLALLGVLRARKARRLAEIPGSADDERSRP